MLARSYLFRDLPPVVLEPITAESRLQHLDRGEAAFRAGDHADALFVVCDGQLKERALTLDGDETVTELFAAADLFGEPGLFAPERRRIVDVVALQRTHLLRIPHTVLTRLLERYPPVAMRLIEALAADVRALTTQLANAGYLRIRDRVVAALLDLANSHGVDDGRCKRLAIELNQNLLAGMVAATRENVNRALGDLTAARAISINGTSYTLDLEALRRVTMADVPTSRRNQQRAEQHELALTLPDTPPGCTPASH